MESVAVKKEREIILYNRLKHCTKEIFRLLTIASIALFIIIAIVFVKYNPVYAVKINDRNNRLCKEQNGNGRKDKQ